MVSRAVHPDPSPKPPEHWWSTQFTPKLPHASVSPPVHPVPAPKPPEHWWSTQSAPKLPQSLVSLMVDAYPTAALIENGRVKEKWIGEMPASYMERGRGFYETITAPVKRPRGAFAG